MHDTNERRAGTAGRGPGSDRDARANAAEPWAFASTIVGLPETGPPRSGRPDPDRRGASGPNRAGRRAVRVLATAALTACAGLLVGPEAVAQRIDGALAAAWHALGEMIVRRDLAALAGLLARESARLDRLGARREALAAQVLLLEARRREAEARAEGQRERLEQLDDLLGPSPEADRRLGSYLEADRERDRLAAAVAALRSALDRADRRLASSLNALRVRRDELLMLRAAAEAQRLDREFAGPDGDRPGWEARSARVAELLRPTPAGRHPQELPFVPILNRAARPATGPAPDAERPPCDWPT